MTADVVDRPDVPDGDDRLLKTGEAALERLIPPASGEGGPLGDDRGSSPARGARPAPSAVGRLRVGAISFRRCQSSSQRNGVKG